MAGAGRVGLVLANQDLTLLRPAVVWGGGARTLVKPRGALVVHGTG